jgi:6,7-dimethyl-8-ribityllumazine synthase
LFKNIKNFSVGAFEIPMNLDRVDSSQAVVVAGVIVVVLV